METHHLARGHQRHKRVAKVQPQLVERAAPTSKSSGMGGAASGCATRRQAAHTKQQQLIWQDEDAASEPQGLTWRSLNTTDTASTLPMQWRIGSHSNAGAKVYYSEQHARAKSNQDRGLVHWPDHGGKHQLLLAVCDGHGFLGEQVSEFVANALPQELAPLLAKKSASANLSATFKRVFAHTDARLKGGSLRQLSSGAGSTASVVLLREHQVWVAWVGDSRCVKGSRDDGGKWVATALTRDHHPDVKGERARLLRAGAVIRKVGDGPERIFKGDGVGGLRDSMDRGYGIVNSRVFGDLDMADFGVTAEPEVKSSKLEERDTCLIVASDGIWDFVTPEAAVELVAPHENASEACKQLIALATERWEKEDKTYRDDITCIVVFLPILEKFAGVVRQLGNAPARTAD